MRQLPAPRRRSDRGFRRLYRRHVGDVYRFALALLRNPADAEQVTRTTFRTARGVLVERGHRPAKRQQWLIAIAHGLCRQHDPRTVREPPVEEAANHGGGLEGCLTCREAELAVSQELDGRLSRSAKAMLRDHLQSCADCAGFASGQRAQRTALKRLGAIPVPQSLRKEL